VRFAQIQKKKLAPTLNRIINMRSIAYLLAAAAIASPAVGASLGSPSPSIRAVDTVFVKEAIDYDRLADHVALRMKSRSETTVIDGDLVVKGRLSVGGEPEKGTDYGVTIHGPVSAGLRFISNEALKDPQRTANQHRHVGTLSLAQDGGLRLDVNSTCFTDSRGCVTEDRARRRAYTGYDSLGDYTFYLSEVDSLTGAPTAPRSQSLVLTLIDFDRNIHINSMRPNQLIYFNGSTTLNATDLQWQVPLAPVPAIR
jgi:hypothetical protein